MKLHTKIFIGMIVGAVGGLILQNSGTDPATIERIVSFVKPVGDVFLRMIFMMVIPLILSALSLGVAELGDIRKVGRVGMKMLYYTVIVSAISVALGVTMANVFQPGADVSPEARTMLMEKYGAQGAKIGQATQQRGVGDILITMIPKNPVEDMARAFDPTHTGGGLLAVMFFTLMIGLAMTTLASEKVQTFKQFLEGMYAISMRVIEFGMKVAPFGVAALLFTLCATFGFALLGPVLKFVLVVLVALAIHQFVTYSILLKTLGKMSPAFFFKNTAEVTLTALSTSSSNATLPTALRVTIEKLKVPKDIAHFVLTIGSTANQNGTALYEGITVLFIAQVFGVHLDFGQQLLVVVLAILGGIGTAGVPSGSLPVIAMILLTVGIPAEAIGVIYGVDRILDMCRTVLNVTGDMTAAVYVKNVEAGKAG